MRAKLATLTFSLFFAAAIASAQDAAPAGSGANSPDYTAVNCSGFVSDKVSDEIHVISGEQSNPKVTFTHGDYVYINRGRDKGRAGRRPLLRSCVRTKIPWTCPGSSGSTN